MRRIASSSAQHALTTLGARLREIRSDAGLSGRDLGRLAGWQSSKISKIEHGRQTPTVADINSWCAHCNAGEHAGDLIALLRAVEGMFVEWRRINRAGLLQEQLRRLPVWQRTKRFRGYASWVVPGLAQTADYVRAILAGIRDRRELADDTDAAVLARLDRQQIIHQPDRRFGIVIEESVLRNSIGGPDIMAAQLGHLLTISTLPTIALGVIPQAADRTISWPIESFWIFDDEQVSVELVSGHLTITQPYEIAQYVKVFSMLTELAVYGAKARTLIAAAIGATGDK
jgi:transcriptional regulator with XRE-family HTH domain